MLDLTNSNSADVATITPRPALPYSRGLRLHELVEGQAASTPQADAIAWGAACLSYAELNARANRLAWYLRGLGVGPESLVAVCLSRSWELPVALLAVLKAGGAYVPLDPAYPAERVAFMLADTRASVVLTEQGLAKRLPVREPVRVVCVDAQAALLGAGCADNLPVSGDAENLAYVIYTSGSTGRPKGVALTHRSAVAFLAWAHTVFTRQELAGTLASTSICFDLSVFEFFAPLSCGGCVILARDVLELPEHPRAAQVTLVNSVPSAMTELVRLRALPTGVRTVNLAGEPLPLRLAQDLHALGHVAKVYNLYGPSEDTTYSTWTLVPRGVDEAPTIGRPIANTCVHILDPQQRPVPLGASGELYIGGEGLARGYLGRPDLTAARFVPDPFDPQAGARLYRTGDLARQRNDGQLVFLGRLDQQVKIRGFRIEPGEIEHALVRHAGAGEAVVVARVLAAGSAPQLIAYVVPSRAAETVDADELRARLRLHLPEYMVPSRIVFLPRLPLTPNGKLDRQALPDPGAAASAPEGSAPQTPTQQVLAALWCELLGLERVALEADFFALGGDSLLALRLLARARAAFALDLPSTLVFESGSLADLAARIDARRGAGLDVPQTPLWRRPDSRPARASFAQERLWLTEQLGSTPAYNVPWVFEIEGPLDVQALVGALQAVVRRHEALRTVLVADAEGLWQRVLPLEDLTLPLEDLASLAPAEAEAEARQRLAAERRQPFDLVEGPVFRARLLRLRADRHLLALTVHHVAADGWSLNVLLDELALLYPALVARRPAALPDLPLQYADWATWQRSADAQASLTEARDYWHRQLAQAPGHVDLPADRARPLRPSFRGARQARLLPPSLVRALDDLARSLGATPFMACLTGFAVLMGRLARQADIVIGVPAAQRTQRETEGLIGLFVNMLALRLDLAGQPSFRELLARVRAVSLAAYAHQELPFEQLVDALRPPRQQGEAPLFQIVATWEQAATPRTLASGLTIRPHELATDSAKFDLTLMLEEQPDGLLATLEYAEDLFDASRIERLLGQLHTLLAAAVAEPERRIEHLPLLTDAELAERRAWNRTAADVGTETIVERIARQARTRPGALALAGPGCQLTYAELVRQSQRLAQRLVALGVAREECVAVCVEPAPSMVVACLAVLAVGAAYVPLDPGHPPDRLAGLLAEARMRVRLVDRPSAARLAPSDAITLCVDDAWMESDAESRASLGVSLEPEQLAYVVYTSGSTGRPKGVGVPHRGLGNLVAWHSARYGLTPADRTSQVAAPSFDAAVWELWPTLASGASLHFPPPATRLSPAALLAWLAEQRITIAFLPTPLAEAVLAERAPAGLVLRALLTGGDRLSARPTSATPFEFVNHYGPTEVSVVTACGAVASQTPGPPSIGAPIANLRVHVVDANLQPAPVGVTGELYVGGVGLARGYVGRPDLTAERFVPDPFDGQRGQRLYRTGDLVRFRPDGWLDFVGRADRQVKLRGVRIEPAEVEAVLTGLAAIEQAVVVVRAERLVAYVVTRAGSVWDEQRLRDDVQRLLPAAMVPAAFVVLERLPLTPHGKIDREALPSPSAPEPTSAAPQTPLERAVAHAWQELLGVAALGRDDDFFRLGGHSLLAGQAVTRLQQALGLPVTLPMIFEAPTVRALAARLGDLAAAASGSEPVLRRVERERYRVRTTVPEVDRG